MCGEIPKGHTARDVVLVFDANSTNVRLGLPFQFHNVVEVRVREVYFQGANFAVGRLKFNLDAVEHEACNAVGEGFVFGLNTGATGFSHTVYTNPRKISDRFRPVLTEVNATIDSLTSTTALGTPGYTLAFFVLTFIMRDEPYTPAAVFEQRQQDPRIAKGEFSTRAPWMKQ